MNIEKLCEEFHEKVGRDKTVKITIEEGNTYNDDGWYIGEINPETLEEIIERWKSKTKKPSPFVKYSKGDGIEYSYISFKQEV